jgi:hypothetical protein
MENKYSEEHKFKLKAEEERLDVNERFERQREMLRENASELI